MVAEICPIPALLMPSSRRLARQGVYCSSARLGDENEAGAFDRRGPTSQPTASSTSPHQPPLVFPPTPSCCLLDRHHHHPVSLDNDKVLHWLPLAEPGDKPKAQPWGS